jgi:hypothetical protein
LVHEAQGTLTTLAGETITYNRPTPIHDALLAAGRSRYRALSDIIGATNQKSRIALTQDAHAPPAGDKELPQDARDQPQCGDRTRVRDR